MSRYAPVTADPAFASAGERLGRLHSVARLVASLAPGATCRQSKFDTEALSQAYDASPTLLQAAFDELVAQTAGFAAAGIEALLDGESTSLAAVDVLADEIARGLEALERMLAR